MINSISTAILHNAYSIDVGGTKVMPSSQEGSKIQISSAIAAPPTTVVNLSKEGLSALEKDNSSRAVDQFLTDHGQELYEKSIKNLKQYPEDIASKFNEKSLSEEELTKMQNALTEREMNAFMKYARQSPPDMKTYFEKYIEYIDTLSPEEQQSDRYRGQREMAVVEYERFALAQGDEPDDMSSSQDPILSLFDLLKDIDFNIKDMDEFIKSFEEKFSPVLNREGNEKLKPIVDNALERLSHLNNVIDAGRDGDSLALEKLKLLAKGEIAFNDYIHYAKELTQKDAA
jgi:hypothetical protein